MDQIINGLSDLLLENKDLINEFKSATYRESFQKLLDNNRPLLDLIERNYVESEQKQEFLTALATGLVAKAKEGYDSYTNKGARNNYLMDTNMLMATYIIPCIVEYKGTSSEPLTDEIIKEWNRVFSQFNLQKGTFNDIDSAFRKKLCYITTAVCQHLEKGDDCYELTLLRNYRDQYLAKTPEGKELIDQYYTVAPQIVFGINQMKQANTIYQDLYHEFLSPCISLIENNELELCKQMYSEMVQNLETTYLGCIS